MDGLLDRRRQLAEGLLAQGLPPAPETPMDRLLNSYQRLWTDTNALQKVGMANVPVVSDVAGLLGDVQQYIQQPEQRTGLNYALSGLGLLPFVPAAFGIVKKAGDVPAMSVRDDLGKIADEIKSARGLQRLDLYPKNDGSIEVAAIEVPKDLRKQGIGTKAMQDVIAYADQQGKRLVLTPALKDERHGTTSRSRLVDFYKRLGFVENKGRNKDFAISDGMYREPKNSGLAESIPDELPAWAPAERMAQWRTARANAALPVEQGGLGLGPANTAAERAQAGGFEGGWGHGSPSPDIAEIRGSATGAEGPGGYATDFLPETGLYSGAAEGAAAYPLMVRTSGAFDAGKGNPYDLLGAADDAELLAKLRATGSDAILRQQGPTSEWLLRAGVPDMPDRRHFVSADPSAFRSRFAAFDPLRRNEADLLASWLLPLMAGGGLLGGYYAQPQAD
jgi:GNAT superfamily N-acetyltransferase